MKGFATKWDMSIFLLDYFLSWNNILIIPIIDNFCFSIYIKNVKIERKKLAVCAL